jgi:hypothetical protein
MVVWAQMEVVMTRKQRKISLNAQKHGAYRDYSRIDRRTWEAKQLAQVEAALVLALGGEPTPHETLIVQRTAVKALRCSILEREILKPNQKVPPTIYEDYLRWSRELRADLQALGLQRKEKKVVDLRDYLEAAK